MSLLLTHTHNRNKKTIAFEYREIMLHAVCRDETAYSRPCVYCQMERAGESMEVRYMLSTDNSTDENPDASVAQNADGAAHSTTTLDDVFRSMSECASLHPDPEDEDEAGARNR